MQTTITAMLNNIRSSAPRHLITTPNLSSDHGQQDSGPGLYCKSRVSDRVTNYQLILVPKTNNGVSIVFHAALLDRVQTLPEPKNSQLN